MSTRAIRAVAVTTSPADPSRICQWWKQQVGRRLVSTAAAGGTIPPPDPRLPDRHMRRHVRARIRAVLTGTQEQVR